MPRFTIFISIVILIASLVLLFDRLFTPQPIQITLQSGQEITTSTPEYFSLSEVLLLIISAFLIGTASTYLFYNSDRVQRIKPAQKSGSDENAYNIILPLLKTDEKRVITALLETGGEMQQNKLAAKLNVSKVKTTRMLYGLEQKNLITKERHGLTNMVRLRK
ncbi:MarR family transcriptional regulator [Candidatus Woesearchaeota archaeon]|nr:MarR family transcriptional regulator [Candidatus Woesearchaeota archaeon]